MRAEAESFVMNPPGASDDATDVARCIRVAIPASSSSGLITLPFSECWYMLTADVDCYLRGGGQPTLGPAVVADFPIFKSAYHNFWVSVNTDGYLRVIGAGVGGFLYLYRSNR